MKYSQHFFTRTTPQSEPIPCSDQVENTAGGYVYQLDKWGHLDRFLILGSEGGTYYVGEHTLTKENATNVLVCIKEDGVRVVNRVVEISQAGRAPKNDPALFVLAMAAGEGDISTRKAALDALPRVARIGTHLFHFLEYVQAFRGWGRGLRTAVANWYNAKQPKQLAYQLLKYKGRDGWTHRDALRKAHPKSEQNDWLYSLAVNGEVGDPTDQDAADWVEAALSLPEMDAEAASQIIADYELPREVVPTELLQEPFVWEALLPHMPMTALIRNLGNLTRLGVVTSQSTGNVLTKLQDQEALKKARVHPLAVLVAMVTYEQGHGMRGSNTWTPVRRVVDALDECFYLSFGNVEPTGKRIVLALDVSGSMTFGDIAGMPITPRVASAAMAMVTARTETDYTVVGFTNGSYPSMHSGYGYNSGISELSISPRQRLDDVVKGVDGLPFGGTDCALPMIWALEKGHEADAFIVYTDNETWAGNIHPSQALTQYRQKTGINAKLVVVGMTATQFTIADPNDAGMLDVVGFDTAAPNVMSQFILA